MDILTELLESGGIVDIMVGFVVVEVVALLLYRRMTGRGIAPLSLLLNVGAGGSLMLALGAVLKNWGTAVLAACLLSALAFHVADLVQRWTRG